MRRIIVRLTAVLTAAAWGVAVAAGPAAAGGSAMSFEQEWYMPGDRARASGLISITNSSDRGWLGDGPYSAYLVDADAIAELEGSAELDGHAATLANAVPIGPVYTRPTSPGLAMVAVEFEVPDLPAGQYTVFHCNDPCRLQLGDLIGGWLWIGGPPPPTTSAPPPTTTAPATSPPQPARALTRHDRVATDGGDSRDWVPWVGATGLVFALALAAGGLHLAARRRA